tara:strand:- start:1769 stop:2050 length:282 start_codon:yes stop_codon:yes gene_type:complete
MESIKFLSLTKINPQIHNFDNLAIPISYLVNKKNYFNLPNYLYNNREQTLSDDKINDLLNLANINKDTFKKFPKTTKKNNIKSNKTKKKKKVQ